MGQIGSQIIQCGYEITLAVGESTKNKIMYDKSVFI